MHDVAPVLESYPRSKLDTTIGTTRALPRSSQLTWPDLLPRNSHPRVRLNRVMRPAGSVIGGRRGKPLSFPPSGERSGLLFPGLGAGQEKYGPVFTRADSDLECFI